MLLRAAAIFLLVMPKIVGYIGDKGKENGNYYILFRV